MFKVNLFSFFDSVNCQVHEIAALSVTECLDYRSFSLFQEVQ